MGRKRHVMAVVATVTLLGAFALGFSGLPGHAIVAALDWAAEHDYIDTDSPVARAVRGPTG